MANSGTCGVSQNSDCRVLEDEGQPISSPIKIKENKSLHVILRERSPDETARIAPEDTRLPAMTLHSPHAILKFRKQTPDTAGLLAAFETFLANLYHGEMSILEKVSGSEWAMIGAYRNQLKSPTIPVEHRIPTTPEMRAKAVAFSSRI
jgi:hypothetical protein